jgi:hypothetical protein
VNPEDLVRIRAHFERFPASVKGAFVMRGADGNPHQVRIEEARAVELAGHGSIPMGVHPTTVEVAPNRDLFVPFEFPITELAPGWYAIECSLAIDGAQRAVRPEARFAIPWPRGTTRRDHVSVGRSIQVGGDKVRVDAIDCASDSTRLAYEGTEASIAVAADGAKVPVLESSFDAETGSGAVTTYPLLKTQHELTVAVKGASAPLRIRLP